MTSTNVPPTSVPIGAIVRLVWSYGYDHGYGFAIIKSHNKSTAQACLLETTNSDVHYTDPLTIVETVTPGPVTDMVVSLMSKGAVRMTKQTKISIDATDRVRPKWQLWDGQPIIETSSHD